jgi:hypothetical protein
MNPGSEQTHPGMMIGVITDAHLSQAEREFPGITEFYLACRNRPRTFLELAWRFQAFCAATRVRH